MFLHISYKHRASIVLFGFIKVVLQISIDVFTMLLFYDILPHFDLHGVDVMFYCGSNFNVLQNLHFNTTV